VKLLAPSTNLRSFGKLFNLEEEKGDVPFSILTSVSSLNLTDLPDELASWRSELTGGKEPTREMIDEAKRLWAKAGCQNLGDYLRAYLRLDIIILYKASQEWRRQLKNLIGLDFVESKKFTISSLSFLAGIKSSAAKKKIGTFFPNNSQTYRLLRRGMRG
jgi:hypothetical protein